ncbi:MAG: accessory gene regulator B family protein [Bacillota bacterium]
MSGFNFVRPAASYLKEKLSLTTEEEEIAVFGMQLIIYALTGAVSVLAIGWLLGCFWTTLTVFMTVVVLRLPSGGAHSGSPLVCAIIGMVVTPALGKLAQMAAPFFNFFSLSLIVVLGLISSVITFSRLAPVDSPAKPITDTTHRRKLRFYSILLIFVFAVGQCWLIFNGRAFDLVWAVSLGLWWQAFSLTGSGHRFAVFTDNLLMKGGE